MNSNSNCDDQDLSKINFATLNMHLSPDPEKEGHPNDDEEHHHMGNESNDDDDDDFEGDVAELSEQGQ